MYAGGIKCLDARKGEERRMMSLKKNQHNIKPNVLSHLNIFFAHPQVNIAIEMTISCRFQRAWGSFLSRFSPSSSKKIKIKVAFNKINIKFMFFKNLIF